MALSKELELTDQFKTLAWREQREKTKAIHKREEQGPRESCSQCRTRRRFDRSSAGSR